MKKCIFIRFVSNKKDEADISRWWNWHIAKKWRHLLWDNHFPRHEYNQSTENLKVLLKFPSHDMYISGLKRWLTWIRIKPPQPEFKRTRWSSYWELKQENPSSLRAPDNETPRKLNRMFPTISLTRTQKRPTCEIVPMWNFFIGYIEKSKHWRKISSTDDQKRLIWCL